MKKKIKTIYKIKFEVEIEITKEITKTRRGIDKIGFSPEMHVKKDVLINGFDPSSDADKEVFDRCSHIEEHFSDRIRLIYGDMFYNEGSTLNIVPLDIKSRTREKVIINSTQMETQMQRQRLPTEKGRNPDKSKKDYLKDKERFITECLDFMKVIRDNGERITQQNLANRYFAAIQMENKVKPLLRKLKLYEISWKDLVAKLPNNVM